MPITQILWVEKREVKETSLREKPHYPKEKIHIARIACYSER
jgi:hypothetical protein